MRGRRPGARRSTQSNIVSRSETAMRARAAEDRISTSTSPLRGGRKMQAFFGWGCFVSRGNCGTGSSRAETAAQSNGCGARVMEHPSRIQTAGIPLPPASADWTLRCRFCLPSRQNRDRTGWLPTQRDASKGARCRPHQLSRISRLHGCPNLEQRAVPEPKRNLRLHSGFGERTLSPREWLTQFSASPLREAREFVFRTFAGGGTACDYPHPKFAWQISTSPQGGGRDMIRAR